MNSDFTGTRLRLRRIGVDTYQQPVVYMRDDCPVCRAEGFEAQSRILVRTGSGRSAIATLNVVSGDWLPADVAGLSEAAWRLLAPEADDTASFSHPDPPESASALRAKVFGERLDDAQFEQLMRDVVGARLSDLELAAFVTACAGDHLDQAETIGLTRAMVAVGERLHWSRSPVLDKHCVGGLPGNRTTPIVVAIVAALGHLIPKTSSRAITSPAGTADTMAMLTCVELDLATLRRVVDREGGCLAWGGGAGLSPADDMLIRVERPLDFDSDAQLTASVLSKKLAAGATHVVIDVPVGATAKVRSPEAAARLSARLRGVGDAVGLQVAIHLSDGRQPVGIGIGPALEARDVLAVLQRSPEAPADLRERALDIAGAVLDLTPGAIAGQGRQRAAEVLADGRAWTKFEAICNAQGGLRVPPRARYRQVLAAGRDGVVAAMDNRQLARLAKLAGAPRVGAAGLERHVALGQAVQRGDALVTVHAEAPGELDYALSYHSAHADMIRLGDAQ